MTDIDVLARTIFGEARNQGAEGMQAVGSVILNRVKSPIKFWGDSIQDCCTHHSVSGVFQFSCWSPYDPNFKKLTGVQKGDKIFDECLDIASRLIEGTLKDNTLGSDSYFADYIPVPKWASNDKFKIKIGSQLFYKLY